MTVSDYITQKYQSFGIQLSEADLLDIVFTSKVSGGEDVSEENMSRITVALVRFVPSLLNRPTSISESGFSMSWDIQGIRDYYSMMCKQYGLEDTLSNKPKVTFL